MRRARVAVAAQALVGLRFRPQGRDPGGLDCIGLAAAALEGAGVRIAVPRDYPLRGGDPTRIAAAIEGAGLVRTQAPGAGDVLLVRPGPGQLHLLVLTDSGFVHADAGLRRVAERPGPSPWPVLGAWRLEED